MGSKLFYTIPNYCQSRSYPILSSPILPMGSKNHSQCQCDRFITFITIISLGNGAGHRMLGPARHDEAQREQCFLAGDHCFEGWLFEDLLLSWRIFTVDILHFDCATGTCWGVEAVFWLSPSSIKSWHDWYPPIPITVTPMNNNWNQPKTLHHLPQNNNIETKLNSDLIKPWLNTTIKIH